MQEIYLNWTELILYYVFLSMFFLHFPIHSFLCKKKYKSQEIYFIKLQILQEASDGKKMLKIAHRGGCREKLENTVEAFQHAKNNNMDMIEMDVFITKDHQVVVCHDQILDRLCGKMLNVNQLNYKELPEYLDEFYLHFSHDTQNNTPLKFKHNSKNKIFPLLEDVFQAFPDMLINVELKYPTNLLCNKVYELLEKYNRKHLTIWGTRHLDFTNHLQTLNKETPLFFTYERIVLTYLYFQIGILPFIYIKEDSMQIPLATDEFINWKLSLAKNSKLNYILTFLELKIIQYLNLISKPLFNHLSKRGILIIYWVLNETNDYDRAISQGVHGIMTDRPSLLSKY